MNIEHNNHQNDNNHSLILSPLYSQSRFSPSLPLFIFHQVFRYFLFLQLLFLIFLYPLLLHFLLSFLSPLSSIDFHSCHTFQSPAVLHLLPHSINPFIKYFLSLFRPSAFAGLPTLAFPFSFPVTPP